MPLVTFALFAYNQQDYIREAIEGALSQTYSPLEIIISDDCSSDQTFQIIEEMTIAYRGPHKVTCSRNSNNLGIAEHVNKINSLANGELIVVAAGDDISIPQRVEIIWDAYLNSNRQSHYFYSVVQKIDESGQILGLAHSPGAVNARSKLRTALSPYPLAIGAGQAWTKKLVNNFHPILSNVWAEDQIFGFRGRLMGEVGFVDRALVNYRVGAGISTRKKKFGIKKYYYEKFVNCIIFWQRTRDAYTVQCYFLAFLIFIKTVALLVTLPISPFLSVFRKMMFWRY